MCLVELKSTLGTFFEFVFFYSNKLPPSIMRWKLTVMLMPMQMYGR